MVSYLRDMNLQQHCCENLTTGTSLNLLKSMLKNLGYAHSNSLQDELCWQCISYWVYKFNVIFWLYYQKHVLQVAYGISHILTAVIQQKSSGAPKSNDGLQLLHQHYLAPKINSNIC